ncbi:MAG: glycosyltransferase family 4 protein [Desulfobacterales bacterium]|nr:glycosyltransferase family 4 protein [Desulfobacterales bacterium]
MKYKPISVLMVGPGRSIVGGITALVFNILPHLQDLVRLNYVISVENREIKDSGRLSANNSFGAVAQYGRFLKQFLKSPPHIVHVHTSQGLGWIKDTFFVLVAKLFRRKAVVHVHAADPAEFYYKYNAVVKGYLRWVLAESDAVITVSEEWRRRVQAIVPAQRIRAMLNCIGGAHRSLPAKGSGRAIRYAIFIGSIGRRKGAFDLLEAVHRAGGRCRGLKILMVGYEESRGDLERFRDRRNALGLNRRLLLLGTVVGEKKERLLRKAEFLVLPSYHEGLPMVVVEAMAAGLAIVATPVGGIPEIVAPDVNGCLVAPGDVDALSTALIRLSTDSELCSAMGRKSLDVVRNKLDAADYVVRLRNIYADLMSAASSNGGRLSQR